jgi:hypothetical protein
MGKLETRRRKVEWGAKRKEEEGRAKSRTGGSACAGTPVLYFCEVKLEPGGSGLGPIRPEAAVH